MELFKKPQGVSTRWASFENRNAGRGSGGRENRGSKGHAFDSLETGESVDLLDVSGSGTITRIWITVSDRSPEMLRSLRLEMFWDGSTQPAVSVPLGDFFGIGLGRTTPFECALFANPEGRSFLSFVPMPFRTSARIVLTNDSGKRLAHLFYDIDLLTGVEHGQDVHYFHAHWRRESPNVLGEDFLILPSVKGSGRFLGCNIGVIADERYEGAWWGEGEVKVWFGDEEFPTLCGTGTEDYIGTGWGQGSFAQRLQGCPIADRDRHQWAFYRYHVDDPVYFDDGCRVAIQTMGGAEMEKTLGLEAKSVPLIPVTIDGGTKEGFVRLLDLPGPIDLTEQSPGWCNFWRQDDWSATALFYLDTPENGLDPLAPVIERTFGLATDEPIPG